ncbi:hypothetical protein AR687_01935 [Flavobacteriaceae bacterium CRH]|nr:hypothetical protein AR687_01935 [Flavobacteriaceae bacterium CRH]
MKIDKTLIIFLIILLQSCNSQTKNKLEKEIKKTTISKPLDIASLTLDEDIDDILTSVNLSKKDTIKNDELTLMGNERLVFSSEKLLVFNKIELANNNSNGTNSIVFHYGKIDPEIGALYNEKNNVVGMYQVNLYTENEIQNLLKNLNLILGKATFEKERNGNVSDIKDNNLIETKEKFKENTFIWKNNNLIYYCFKKYSSIDNNELQNSVSLFVFNKNNKEWIGFISGLGYQHTENCLDK